MRALIVERDRALGVFLQKGLQLQGHEATWEQTIPGAMAQCAISTPDLMVVGLDLSDETSFASLATLKGALPNVPLLVVAEDCGVEDRVRCLDAGADDCLVKPLNFFELAARCRAMLRRGVTKSEPVLSIGGLDLDLSRRTVRSTDRHLELTPKEFALLECLVRRNGHCCSRADLLREVWQVSVDASTNVVDVYVTYLRRKLSSTFGSTCGALIETIRGTGYRINPAAYATSSLVLGAVKHVALRA